MTSTTTTTTVSETGETTRKDDIIAAYKAIVHAQKRLPRSRDFAAFDINRDAISRDFGGMEYLHEHMRVNYNQYLGEFFSSVEDVFSSTKNVKHSDKKVFVVTTAVADAPADEGFLRTLQHYCKLRNAQLVIMPCESVTNSFENKTAVFDPIFMSDQFMFVQEDTPLNSNMSLCSIQVSAKQIKSITGLSRLGNREGSYVFASPKQFLEYVPSGNKRGKNYAIMTPGACTRPSYYTETFVSKRLSYIAASDHTVGAIVIEVHDDVKFDFTQIQAAEDGSFVDQGVLYLPSGEIRSVPVNLIFGDVHSAYSDQEAVSYFIDRFKHLDVDNLFLHDVFDAYSISHHVHTIAERAQRSNRQVDDLSEEVRQTYQLILSIDQLIGPSTIQIVKSNHDEFLDRYLAAGSYVNDPKNHYFSLKVAPALFESRDPLKEAMEIAVGERVPSHWNFLSRGDSVRIGGVECAAHGDLGMNGARPSLNSIEMVYGNCVTGHAHSAAIQRGAFRVGTLSQLDMRYNRGPSSWTQTCCMLYDNGQRQLINYVR
jgi:hypothetical protein